MNTKLNKAIIWIFLLLPYVYLATIWHELPDRVATHFNIDGDADAWSNKTMLIFIPSSLGLFVYGLLAALPKLDPKNTFEQMGNKFFSLQLMLILFFSVLAIYLLYSSKVGCIQNPNIVLALVGFLFAFLGNYFQTIRPNYFIGIRTPWTLESEIVWKKTHRLGGIFWMFGGITIVILAFLINNKSLFMTLFFIISAILVLVPTIYSYIEFQKQKTKIDL